MLTVLLVLVSLLTVDLLFTRGVQFLTWVRSLDPVVTREVDAVNADVVRSVEIPVVAVEHAATTVVADTKVVVADVRAAEVAVVADTKVVENAVSTVASDVSTVATDVAKEATVVVADVKKL